LGRNTKINTKTRRSLRTNLKKAKKEDEMWRNTKRKKKSAGMVALNKSTKHKVSYIVVLLKVIFYQSFCSISRIASILYYLINGCFETFLRIFVFPL